MWIKMYSSIKIWTLLQRILPNFKNQKPNPQQSHEIIKFEISSMVNPIGSMIKWGK